MHHCLLYTWSHTSGLARNGEQSRACVPQHTPNIILGVLLSCTLDIKIAHLLLIFNLVVLHVPPPPIPPKKKGFIII